MSWKTLGQICPDEVVDLGSLDLSLLCFSGYHNSGQKV